MRRNQRPDDSSAPSSGNPRCVDIPSLELCLPTCTAALIPPRSCRPCSRSIRRGCGPSTGHAPVRHSHSPATFGLANRLLCRWISILKPKVHPRKQNMREALLPPVQAPPTSRTESRMRAVTGSVEIESDFPKPMPIQHVGDPSMDGCVDGVPEGLAATGDFPHIRPGVSALGCPAPARRPNSSPHPRR